MGIGNRWKIGSIAGIPFYIATSWVFVAGLYVWLQFDRLTAAGATASQGVLLGVFATAVFFGSILLHEGAHAVTARLLDLPVLGVTLVFWGGATETKAYDRGPGSEFLVAVVGPLSTLAVAGALWAIAGTTAGLVHEILRDLALLNVFFAAFNALPGYPLDGGRVLLAVVWALAHDRRIGMRAAGYTGLAMGVVMLVVAVRMFLDGEGMWLFLGYVGFVLANSGRKVGAQIAFTDLLAKGRVSDAMRPPPPTIAAELSLTQALDEYLRGSGTTEFPVARDGAVIGTVSMASARRVGARNPMRPVADAVVPLSHLPWLAPQETLDTALPWIGKREGLVLDEGRAVGALDTSDVERWYKRVIEGRPEFGAGVDPWDGVVATPDEPPPRPDE